MKQARENLVLSCDPPTLAALRAEEDRLQAEIDHNKRLLARNLPCCDLAALALRRSDLQKQIASLTVGKLQTA